MSPHNQISEYLATPRRNAILNPPYKYASRDEFEADAKLLLDITVSSYVSAVRAETELRRRGVGYVGAERLNVWYVIL